MNNHLCSSLNLEFDFNNLVKEVNVNIFEHKTPYQKLIEDNEQLLSLWHQRAEYGKKLFKKD